MNLKNLKTLRKCEENLQPQMPELQFLKTLIFPRAFQKLQKRVNSSIFVFKTLFSILINYGSTILFSKHGKIKDGNVELCRK